MDLDLAEFAVDYAIKLGAKYADARLETTSKNEFILKNGVPQMAGFDRVQGIGIRIDAGGCFGFTSTNELEKEKIKDAVERAVKITSSACRISSSAAMSEEPVENADY